MTDADTTWALVVGIDVYDHVKQLNGPVRDAIAVVAWLRKLGVTDDRILLHASPCPESRDLLKDLGIAHQGCTEPEIWQSLSTLLSNSGSRLFVFLLGHGYYLFDGGSVFLTKEADANAATNFGIRWLSSLLLAKNYQRQFILMDGCMNYAYAASQRPTITPGAHPGVAVGAALSSVSQWFGFAASPGQTAAEPDGRGLFTTMLLAALDPEAPDPRCTTIDDATGVYQIDFDKAITDAVNPDVTQRISTQRPGFKRMDEGPADIRALVVEITPAQTVELQTLLDPMAAAPDVDCVTLSARKFQWKRTVPHPAGAVLNLPVTSVLPSGLKLTGWCEMKPNTDWADPDDETVTTGTGNDVVFKLNRDRSIDVVKVTTVGADDVVVAAMNSDAVTEVTNIIARAGTKGKVWLSPSRTGGIVYVTAGEEEHLESVSRRIADAINRKTRSDVHITRERQQLLPAESKPRWHGWRLDVDLGRNQARALGGFLADRPCVDIGDSRRMSLLDLADLGEVAIDGLAPVRVVLDLPWGRWVTIVEPPDPAGITPRLVFPDDVGLPPVRNRLRDNVLQSKSEAFVAIRAGETAFALAVMTTEPADLHVSTGDLASRLFSGNDRTDDWPAVYGTDKEMPGGPTLYRRATVPRADWPIGKLDVGTSTTPLFFPMSYPNLAFDNRIAPRIEPLSVSTETAWDRLVSAGRLTSIGPRDVKPIVKAGDPVLMLAGMYGCFVNGLDDALDYLQGRFPQESEDPDIIILRHAYAMKLADTSPTAESSVLVRPSQLTALATDGRVPVFKWGLSIGQAVAQHYDVPALATKLKRIEDRLQTASIWTLWQGDPR